MDAVSIHEVRPDAFNYVWDNSLAPALEVESGETVELHVRDASDEQIGRDSDAEDVAKLDFTHVNPVSGPVYMKGARPGDVLAVELLELRPPEWGWTAIIPGFGLLADEYPEPWLRVSEVDAASGTVRFGDGIALPYRPFPGTIGVAPEEPGQHSIVPPSRFGGNMDVKHLRAGVKLFLPVGVEGALFSLGDTHAAQGDGEVCGTAIETTMEVVLRLSVRKDVRIDAPQYDIPAGAVAGWALLATYSCFIAANFAEIGLFGTSFLDGVGVWHNPSWIVVSLVAAALVWALAYGDVKVVTRALLSFEGISVTLIVILIVVIFWKVIGHSAPNHQGFTLKPFAPASGTTVGAVAFASVFGLLSFGGFEGAAALGEETNNPRRNIPLAIAAAVAFCGVFYTIVMLAQSLGFGIDAAGIKAFSTSSAPLSDLSKSYVGSGMADAINFGATLSAFASCLGCAAGASRILFALGRDGFVTRRLGDASSRTGSPANALFVVMVLGLAATIALRVNNT